MSADIEGVQDPGEVQRQAARGSLWSFGNTVLSVPLAFVASVLVARALGPGALGQLTVWLTFTGLVNQFANAGFSDATVQWFRSTQQEDGVEAARRVLRACAGYHWLVQAPATFLATAGVLLFDDVNAVVALVTGALAAATQVVGTSAVILTATNQSIRAAQIAFVSTTVTTVGALVAAQVTGEPALVFLVRTGVALLTTVAILVQLPGPLRRCVFRPVLPVRLPTGMWSYALKGAGASLVTVLVFARTEVLLLSAYGFTTDVAVYGIALALAGQLTSPLDALMGPLVPAAASLRATDRARFVSALLRSLGLSAFLAGVVFALLLPALVELVPSLYGSAYSGVVALLVPLAVVSVVQSMLHPLGAFGAAARVPGRLLAVSSAAVVVDLGAAFALVPSLGGPGAVVANSLGQLVFLGGLVLVVSGPVGITTGRAARACVALLPGLVTGAVVLLLLLTPGWPDGVVGALAAGGASLLLGAAVLRLGPRVPGLLGDVEALGGAVPARLRPLTRLVVVTQRRGATG